MANISVGIDIELEEEDRANIEPTLRRRYAYANPDDIKQLSEDTGLLGKIIRSVQQDFLLMGE